MGGDVTVGDAPTAGSEVSLSIRAGAGARAEEAERAGVDREALERTIELIRPALRADGGDMRLVDVDDDGVVTVSLVGACGTCPISVTTLKGGVERILKDRVPGVTEVVSVD